MRKTALGVALVALWLGLGTTAAAMQAASSDAQKKPARAAKQVDLNKATAAELESLPGIGPKMAARILEYRQKNGSFKKIEELMNVRGIGEKNFLKLKPLITATPAGAARRAGTGQ